MHYYSYSIVNSIQVGNAQEELLHWYAENAQRNPHIFRASERCASGIIQAMRHFNLQPNVSPRDKPHLLDGGGHRDEYAKVAHLVVEFHLLWEKWERAEVEKSEEIFKSLKDSLVHD